MKILLCIFVLLIVFLYPISIADAFDDQFFIVDDDTEVIDDIACDADYEYESAYLLAKLLFHECRGENIDVQQSAAQVVINRMLLYDKDINEIIFERGQFTPARNKTLLENTVPTKNNMIAAYNAYIKREFLIADYVCFFRSYRYHRGLIKYRKIGALYFSYSERDRMISLSFEKPRLYTNHNLDFFLENYMHSD